MTVIFLLHLEKYLLNADLPDRYHHQQAIAYFAYLSSHCRGLDFARIF
ncbi:MAG: hypothetical protein ACK5P2_04065 [Pseudanabaena sp.]